jgi:pyrroloquinoline quinone biosynthesis protein D
MNNTTTPLEPSPPVRSEIALPQFPRLSRVYRMQYEEVQSAWVLLYPEGMVKLNQSAAEILRRCNGERTVAEIVADLELAFNTTALTPQVNDMLQEGVHRGWIT